MTLNTNSDAELDKMLAEWANEEIDVPEGFHDSVMNRLRAEQAPQKKGNVISLAERFANKKAWVSTIAAAALVLCCLPVLQDRQDNLAGVENSASQVYEMKSRTMNSDGTAGEPAVTNILLEDTQDIAATVNGAVDRVEKQAASEQVTYDYASAASPAALTLEEQLKLAQDNLAEMEAHLATLDDSAEAQVQREELQNKIDELNAEIKKLEEELNKLNKAE